MLRVNSSCVLVVPPFECAWLSGEEHVLRDGAGCISFEVKGDNDVTIIIKPSAGSKRWQHMQRPGHGDGAQQPEVDPNYTVILGSHGNRCLKIEKNGTLCCMVPGAKLPGSDVFSSYWVDYNAGAITVGCGVPGERPVHRWVDPAPLLGLRYVGLSSWDKHVGYKNIRVGPPLDFATLASQRAGAGDLGVGSLQLGPPPLTALASTAVADALAPCNVVGVLRLAHALAPALDAVQQSATAFVARHFEAVLAEDEAGLAQVPVHCLVELLQHPELNCPEFVLFHAAMCWAARNPGCSDSSPFGAVTGSLMCPGSPLSPAAAAAAAPVLSPPLRVFAAAPVAAAGWCLRRPMSEVEAVLPLLRFPLMAPEELQAVAQHPILVLSPLLKELLQEAGYGAADHASGPGTPAQQEPPQARLPYAVQGTRLVHAASVQEALAAVRFQRRRPPAWRELIYICDGDANGVCHHLGSNQGREQWVNPALAGRVSISASSPPCRYTDPKGLVSRQFSRTSFAGPAYDAGRLASWWQVDLGERCRLVCNYYSIRHDGSTAFVRSWSLQGSLDGRSWVDLRVHRGDATLKLPGQYGSWPVAGPAAVQPWRLFRIMMTGPSADPHSPYNLCISDIEFYGYFFTTDGQQQ